MRVGKRTKNEKRMDTVKQRWKEKEKRYYTKRKLNQGGHV